MPEFDRWAKSDPTLAREPLQKIAPKGPVHLSKRDPTLKAEDSFHVQKTLEIEESKEQDISDADLFEQVGEKFGDYLAQYFKDQDAPCFENFFKWRGRFPVEMLHFESCTDDNGNFHVNFRVGIPEIRRKQIQKKELSVIMSYYRAMKDRQEYQRLLEEKRRNDAATVITSYFKAMMARRQFNKDRDEYREKRAKAVTTIAQYYKAMKGRQEYNRERAAMIIASYWKAMKARQSFNQDLDEYRQRRDDAVTTIASFWKAMKAREQFSKDLAVQRAHQAEAATTIASYFKAMMDRRQFNEDRDAYRAERNEAATIIASHWKAMKARQLVQSAIEAEKQRRNDAITTIGSYYKAMVARREVCAMIQEERHRKFEELTRQHEAATIIKSYYKAMVARRKMKKYLGIVATRRKKKEEERKKREEEERRLEEVRREEEERLAKIVSIKVSVGKNKPELVVPMRVGGTLEQLRRYMVETYGLEEEDVTKIKVGKEKVAWNTTLDELQVEEIGKDFKVNLKLPDANGRQKVFMHLDRNHQRVLHKDTFYSAVTQLGIDMSPKQFNRVWRILDTDNQNVLSYKLFQNVIAPEANLREFAAMISVLSRIPEDEYAAFKKSRPNVKRDYVFAQSQVVSDNARLHRLMKVRDIYSLFGALDAYMEGRLTINLFQRLLDIAGLEVNQVHLHYLQAKLNKERNRSYLTVEDFLRLMNGEEYVTMDDVLERINEELCGITNEEYMANWKRIYQSKSHQQKMEKTYRLSRRSPREVLGLAPLSEEELEE